MNITKKEQEIYLHRQTRESKVPKPIILHYYQVSTTKGIKAIQITH
jgi:hypothetical protein